MLNALQSNANRTEDGALIWQCPDCNYGQLTHLDDESGFPVQTQNAGLTVRCINCNQLVDLMY